MYLRTIDLLNLQGITFLYSVGRLYGIFPHTSSKSSAFLECQRLSERRQLHTVWIYLPISPNDKITGLGVRKNDDGGICFMVYFAPYFSICFLTNTRIQVRTERAGDTIIGPQPHDVERVQHLMSQPAALVVNESSRNTPVVLGAYSGESSSANKLLWPVSRRPTQKDLGIVTYFSTAPLSHVERARVFKDDTGFCRGILFEYANGLLRAVGQCRLGVDHYNMYEKPSAICSRTHLTQDRAGRELYRLEVVLSSYSLTCPPQGEWDCWPLSNTLHFWFSEYGAKLSVL